MKAPPRGCRGCGGCVKEQRWRKFVVVNIALLLISWGGVASAKFLGKGSCKHLTSTVEGTKQWCYEYDKGECDRRFLPAGVGKDETLYPTMRCEWSGDSCKSSGADCEDKTCRCKSIWTSGGDCSSQQQGCPSIACDGDHHRWCIVENPHCSTLHVHNDGQYYIHCDDKTPVVSTCDGSTIFDDFSHTDRRESGSTGYLAPGQPVGSTLVFPCSTGYENGPVVYTCAESGQFKVSKGRCREKLCPTSWNFALGVEGGLGPGDCTRRQQLSAVTNPECALKCKHGYFRDGKLSLRCDTNGQLQGWDMSCTEWRNCDADGRLQIKPGTARADAQCGDDKQCRCKDGINATGTDCRSDKAQQCIACNDGFFLQNNACIKWRDCDAAGKIYVEYGSRSADAKCGRDKVCTCDNGGTPANGAACPADGQAKCVMCPDKFFLDNFVCKPWRNCDQEGKTAGQPGTGTTDATCGDAKQCICKHGYPAAGSLCSSNGAAECVSCVGKFFLDGVECRPYTDCGAEGKTYRTVGSNTADAVCAGDKICSCENGTAAKRNECPADGQHKCVACNEGAYLRNSGCKAWTDCDKLGNIEAQSGTGATDVECGRAKQCACDHGTGAKATACPKDGASKCMTCTHGFFLDNDVCTAWADCDRNGKVQVMQGTKLANAQCGRDKICKCVNGDDAMGTACPRDGQAECAQCDHGFFLRAGQCLPWKDCGKLGRLTQSPGSLTRDAQCGRDIQCTCKQHGTAAHGRACPQEGAAKCMACQDGYSLDATSACVANDCHGSLPSVGGFVDGTCTRDELTDQHCVLACRPGYEMTPGSNAHVWCQGNGAYSKPLGGCSAVPCPANSIGVKVAFGCKCKYGYHGHITASTVHPYFSGKCEPLICPDLEVAKGSVTYSDPSRNTGSPFQKRQEFSQAAVTCEKGWARSGNKGTRRCRAGNWTGAEQTCLPAFDVIVDTAQDQPGLAVALGVGIVVVIVVVVTMAMRAANSSKETTPQYKSLLLPSFQPITGAFVIPFAELELDSVLGMGGQGQVWKGSFSGKPVAAKELLAAMFDPAQTHALTEEASVLCSIHHPNIVRFYGMAVQDADAMGKRHYFLVTDLKDGDLRQLLEKKREMSSDEVLRIACQICEPLAHLHSIGMVHRDLKPENILYDSDMTMFLCDFGLSKSFRAKNKTNVDLTLNMGTAAYMAPELTSLTNFVEDYSRNTLELKIADSATTKRSEKDRMLAEKHTSAVNAFELTEVPGTHHGEIADQSAYRTKRDLAPKVDCYSYALVLWALLSWETPFNGMDGLQILVAVSYHNKRPATKDLDGVWPAPVLKLMKEMWNSNPMDRPSMVEARDLLRSVVVQNQNKEAESS